jgi:hypothetical protein
MLYLKNNMSKNKARIIIVAVILLVIVALIIFYLLYSRQTGGPGGEFPEFPDGSPGTGVEPGSGESGGGIPGTGVTEPGYGFDVTPPDRYTNAPGVYKRLKRISSLPVAGYIVFDKNNSTFIRYIERGSGDILETKSITAESPYRIAKTSIPKIYEAYFTDNGESVIVRFLKTGGDEIQTFYVSMKNINDQNKGAVELTDGVFLPLNITSLAVSPSGKRIFYVQKTNGGSVGITASPDSSNKKQIFDSPLSEWQTYWKDDDQIVLLTSPSYLSTGFVYSLNSQTGDWERLFGNIMGLMVLPDATTEKFAYYSYNENTTPTIHLYDRSVPKITQTNLKTIPEKCVWSRVEADSIYCAADGSVPTGEMPDSWYMGMTTFQDKVWKINTETGQVELVFDPLNIVAEKMDMFDLQLDSKDKHLIFRNKKDHSLWLYDLEEN